MAHPLLERLIESLKSGKCTAWEEDNLRDMYARFREGKMAFTEGRKRLIMRVYNQRVKGIEPATSKMFPERIGSFSIRRLDEVPTCVINCAGIDLPYTMTKRQACQTIDFLHNVCQTGALQEALSRAAKGLTDRVEPNRQPALPEPVPGGLGVLDDVIVHDTDVIPEFTQTEEFTPIQEDDPF